MNASKRFALGLGAVLWAVGLAIVTFGISLA
jgi:hypothetical protein